MAEEEVNHGNIDKRVDDGSSGRIWNILHIPCPEIVNLIIDGLSTIRGERGFYEKS